MKIDTMLFYSFFGTGDIPCIDAADANDDGKADLTDVIFTLGYLFLASGDIPDPGFTCGTDPTDDGLPCVSFGPCEW